MYIYRDILEVNPKITEVEVTRHIIGGGWLIFR